MGALARFSLFVGCTPPTALPSRECFSLAPESGFDSPDCECPQAQLRANAQTAVCLRFSSARKHVFATLICLTLSASLRAAERSLSKKGASLSAKKTSQLWTGPLGLRCPGPPPPTSCSPSSSSTAPGCTARRPTSTWCGQIWPWKRFPKLGPCWARGSAPIP